MLVQHAAINITNMPLSILVLRCQKIRCDGRNSGDPWNPAGPACQNQQLPPLVEDAHVDNH